MQTKESGLYKSLFDSFPESALALDRDFRVLSANHSFYDRFKTDPFGTIGHSVFELGTGKWEIPTLMEQLDNISSKSAIRKFEAECFFAGAGRKIMLIRIRPIPAENSGAFFLLTFEDITEQKKAKEDLEHSELRYRALLGSVPDIIMELNGDKIYTWSNRAGIEFFGEDIIGKEAIFHNGEEQGLWDDRGPLFTERKDDIYIEGWQLRQDGERRLMAWWCRVLKDSEGNAAGALATARDITEQKLAEVERMKLISQLREALGKVNLLSGMLPICSYCKKIRDDRGYWNQIESYIRDHSDAEFSHGICPGCAKEFYPQYFKS